MTARPSRPTLRDLRHKVGIALRADLHRENPIAKWGRVARFIVDDMRGGDVSFRAPDGSRFVSMPNNYSSYIMCATGARDAAMWRLIERSLRPGSTFVDAGANIGTYTVPAARLVGPSGRVAAFEAHPTTYGYLRRNVEANRLGNVDAANVALGAEPGEVRMAFDAANPGETHVADGSEAGVSVTMRPLDDALASLGIRRIDYLKVDVEGFEMPVLAGARGILAASPDVLVQTELVDGHGSRYGGGVAAIADLLGGLGFVPHAVSRDGTMRAVAGDLPSEAVWARPGRAA